MSTAPNTDFDGHIQRLQRHLDVAQGQAAESYAQHRQALGAHHGAMETRVTALQRKQGQAAGPVREFLEGGQEALTPAVAQQCLEYLQHNADLYQALSARRLAFGATQPPGSQAMGEAVGTPGPAENPDAPEAPLPAPQ